MMDNEREALEGIRLTKELIDLITKAMPVRKDTIRVLQEMATELENVNQGENITKVVGYGVSLFGGIATGTGIALSGGTLAVPLLRGETVESASETTTKAGSDMYGKVVSIGKLEKAQDALNKEKEVVFSIEEIFDKLDKIATSLSKNLKRDRTEILGSICSNAIANVDDTSNILLPIDIINLKHLSLSTKLIRIGTYVTKMATKATSKGVGKKASNVAFSSLFVFWDAEKLVQTSMELSCGSKIGAATELRQIGDQLFQENKNLEKILQDIRTQSEQQIDAIMSRKMHALLIKIADAKETDFGDEEVFRCYAKRCTSDEWMVAYANFSVEDKSWILQKMARLYRFLIKTIDDDFDEKGRKLEKVVMTLIAHGSLDTKPSSPTLPCSLFYSTTNLKDIRFYQPWGYEIGPDVVVGILNNVMIIENVGYNPTTLAPFKHPESWNSLPKTAFESIYCPIFSPIRVNENVLQNLQALRISLPAITPGIVILFTEDVEAMIQLNGVIHLFLLTSALGLIGRFFDIEIEFRYAACLTPSHNSNWSNNLTQYYRYSGTQMEGQAIPRMVWNSLLNGNCQNVCNNLLSENWQKVYNDLSKFRFG